MGFFKGNGIGGGAGGVPGNMLLKGNINQPSDFPLLSEVQIGDVYIIGQKEVIATLTNAANVATASISSTFYNKFINGNNITVAGYIGAEAGYNGTFVGTKSTPNDITYPIPGLPPSPASGIGTIAAPDIVTDNDGSKTNTGQTFQNGNEIVWNGADWSPLGPDHLFLSDGNKIKQVDPTLDVEFDGNTRTKQELAAEDEIFSGIPGSVEGEVWAYSSAGAPHTKMKGDVKSEFPKGITDLPDPTLDDDVMNKGYADATYAANFPTVTTFWYDLSGGSDSAGNGEWGFPFLTMQKSVDTIDTNIPTRSETLQVAAQTKTNYNFSESLNLTGKPWINIYARGCGYRCNTFTIGGNNIVELNFLKRISGIGDVIVKANSGESLFKANKVINDIALGGGIFVNEGIFKVKVGYLSVAARTDTLITANPATSNKELYVDGDFAQGKIFTTSITDKWYIHTNGLNDCDLNANAASQIHLNADVWNGNILAAGALAEIYLRFDKRTSDPLNDVYDETAKIRVIKPQEIWHYTASQSLKVTQAGDIFTNKGASSNINFTLPKANTATEGLSFIISAVEDHRITCTSSGSAFRFVEATGSIIGAGNVFTVHKGSTVKLINMGEFSTYGYWLVIPLVGALNA